MDIREINTILIEPVDVLSFETNRIVYQSTGTSALRRTSQQMPRRSPRATYARPRPPSRHISGALQSETKAMQRSRITEPLARQHQPNRPTLVAPLRLPSEVTQQMPPAPKRSLGVPVYFLLLMLLLVGVLGGIGFGYLLSASQSLPAQLSFSSAHHLINTHVASYMLNIRG